MNKTLIVVLAICLVTVHAFVKRDAPAANQPSGIEDLTKKIEQLADTFKQDVQKAFDPETIKTNFNNMVDTINKQLSNLKPADSAPKQ